ncbi:hypothetical protein AF332_11980 [Sporosarcina globispora]|uniref:Uncharacterized protein n=1 Tax=Sporosarcina globispora TaxID=1459 RepID=A0A0M0GC57_SPOGL|nr:hypothetical protein [Sporosarcina globispora]KON87475.1 hypothetical protein AF332_11980 [Sporosarcina globispora]
MEGTFANKRFVGQKIVAQEDGTLLTQFGDFPVKKGEIIFKPLKGDPVVVPENYFNENYTQVEAANKEKVKVNLDEMARGYMEMGYLNQKEDESYINELKELSKNKAF